MIQMLNKKPMLCLEISTFNLYFIFFIYLMNVFYCTYFLINFFHFFLSKDIKKSLIMFLSL